MFTILEIRKMQLRTTLRFHQTPEIMIKNNQITTNVREDIWKTEPYFIVVGFANWCSPMEISTENSQTDKIILPHNTCITIPILGICIKESTNPTESCSVMCIDDLFLICRKSK